MASLEIMKKVGLLPSILYLGGWIFIGVLILVVLYYFFLYII
ncbi:MAG: hypothetical protein AB6733_16850 [Clostridiaceae bacterium]